MPRETIDLLGLEGLEDSTFVKSARLVLPHPRHGGPSLLELRTRLRGKGRIRITAQRARVFVDVDPGETEAPLIALDTIARDDAAGLERMLLSVLPFVDEIVLGIDGRSGPETAKIARMYADVVHIFDAADIGLTDEEWTNNKIDFSKARNIGRAQVKAPWTLVLDTDEYLAAGARDMREAVQQAAPGIVSFKPGVIIHGSGSVFEDPQRLAYTKFRWERGTHNMLLWGGVGSVPIDFKIISDTNLRSADEKQRRDLQRNNGIEELVADADKGDLAALFQLANHRTYGSPDDFAQAIKLVEDYRLRCEPHSILADDRAWLALGVAFRFYQDDKLEEADRWCCRVLLDGPHVAAFCLLGDIAEAQGDVKRALAWYKAACSIEEVGKLQWPGLTEMRYARLSGIQKGLLDPENASRIGDIVLSDA